MMLWANISLKELGWRVTHTLCVNTVREMRPILLKVWVKDSRWMLKKVLSFILRDVKAPNNGTYDPNTNTIHIRESASLKDVVEVFVHEGVHGHDFSSSFLSYGSSPKHMGEGLFFNIDTMLADAIKNHKYWLSQSIDVNNRTQMIARAYSVKE